MPSAKQRKVKGGQASLHGSICDATGTMKSQRSSGGRGNNKSDGGAPTGIDVVPTHCATPTTESDSHSDKNSSPRINCKSLLDSKQRNEQMLHPSSKIKLQLFPLDERIRAELEKDGHNPFLELTLSSRKKITSVLKHLCDKWGRSSVARGELLLFPFNAVVEKLTSYERWSSTDVGISAGDVYALVGNPETFRLRYGWVSSQLNSSIFSPSLVCNLGKEICSAMATVDTLNQAEKNSKEIRPCNTNELINLGVEQTVPAELPNFAYDLNKAERQGEDYKTSKNSEIEKETAAAENSSAEPVKFEEARMDDKAYQAPILFSDLSNMSIGGLFSEASLQGIFGTQGMKSGNSRLTSQSAAESLDAFMEQLKKFPPPSTSHPSNMSLSILDAEDTCHSFAFSKPAAGRDFLTLGRSAFSGLSDQDTASRPFKCPRTEAIAENGTTGGGVVKEPNTDPLPCSAGVYNNENSLGLSSIRWNDSLGPFDLPLVPRQIVKDDSISMGRIVR